MRRKFCALCVVCGLSLALGACGQKGPLRPPAEPPTPNQSENVAPLQP